MAEEKNGVVVVGSLGSVFELTYEETPLVKIFNILCGTQLDPNDDLPKNVCENCIGEAIRFCNFRKNYEASEAALRNIVAIKVEVDAEIKSEPIGDSYCEELEETQLTDKNMKKQSRIFACSCEKTFASKLEFRQHRELTDHSLPHNHPCKICGKLFSKRSLWTHSKTHEAVKPYGCDKCEVRFVSNSNLQRHMLIHTGERPHVCDVCGKGFTQLKSLKVHSGIHTDEKPFLCALCGKCFKQKTNFNNHVQKHNTKSISDPLKKFACDECGRVCYSQTAYKLHLYKHGLGEGPIIEGDQHRCDVCKKFYASEMSLANHRQIHTEKRFLCDECGKVFLKKSVLETHYLRHTGEKPFVCEFCDKKFAQQPGLQKHRLIHTGEKPYTCALCPKKFRQGAHLNRHLVVHTGERPYVCQFCEKSYPQKESLNIHLRTHTGEKPFNCDLCASVFYDAGSLKKHKQRKHPDI